MYRFMYFTSNNLMHLFKFTYGSPYYATIIKFIVGFIVVLRNIAHDIETDPCRDITEEESRISDLCMYICMYYLLNAVKN